MSNGASRARKERLFTLRRQVARQIIESDLDDTIDVTPLGLRTGLRAAEKKRLLPVVDWPDRDLKPVLSKLDPAPGPDQPLPEADWLVITWTVDEHKALKEVFAPSLPTERWHLYRHNFARYAPDLKSTGPAARAGRIGSYCMVEVAGKRVLCLKSEFHLNQDGPKLPLRPLTRQLIEETGAKNILSIGTAGGVGMDDELGDVMVSQSALFKCGDEFEDADFNGKKYVSNWNMDKRLFKDATKLMIPLQEPPYAPPTKRVPFDGRPVTLPPNKPHIAHFTDHPIITTDFFEFGTSANRLDKIGCAVEMDDAVIAMVCQELGPHLRYAFVRNVSDPVINADLDERTQVMWAAAYYERFGRQTSYNGALATWAIIAAN
ncbi:MAG: hypothetical protein AB1753_02120 [Thermoproteota archaeon]|nr:hypothetical protein Josef01_10c16_30 [uncultured archaeon]